MSTTLKMIGGLALLVGGMALTIGPAVEAETTKRLASTGVHTTATVTREEVSRSRRVTSVRLHLEYEDTLGLSVESSETYCGEPGDRSTGETIDIVYDPDDPEVFQFDDCEYMSSATAFVVGGVVALALGCLVVLRAWRSSGWRFGFWGIAIALIGIVFVGASLDDSCECKEGVYFGGSLAIIGTVATVARTARARYEQPPDLPGEGTSPPSLRGRLLSRRVETPRAPTRMFECEFGAARDHRSIRSGVRNSSDRPPAAEGARREHRSP